MAESKARLVSAAFTSTGDIKSENLDNVTLTVYATIDDLPTSGLTSGQQAFITSINRLYVSNGSGWFSVALINATPRLTIDPTGTVVLATDGSTPTVITLTGTDSDNVDASLIYSVESDGSFGGLATLSQDSSVFTITPLAEDSATTTSSTLTFKVSDGISFGSGTTAFSLTFGPDWSATPTETEIASSDLAASDLFGTQVSISSDGDYAIVGAHGEDPGGTSAAGAAYIFVRSGSTWTQQAKLTASDGDVSDQFGSKVEISGDGTYAIVGASREDGTSTDMGAAYIFVRSGSTWTQQQKLQASDKAASDLFGWGVSISDDGSYAVVSALFEDPGGTSQGGSAYIFTRSGSTWSQQAKIVASDIAADDRFGEHVAMNSDGTYVVVGSMRDDVGGTNYGSAYIFTRSGSTWSQQAKINPSPTDGVQFGYSVAINNDATYIAVGAPYDASNGANAGAVWIFTRSGSSWSQQVKLLSSDIQAGDFFGNYVSFNSDATYLAAGARLEDGGSGDPTTSSGAAYVFERDGSTWTEVKLLTASNAAVGATYGQGVSINSDGKYLIIGAPETSAGGAAYIYEA